MRIGNALVCAMLISSLPFGVARATSHSVVTLWEASSGDHPTEHAPLPWNLFDDATPEEPVLSGGILTLSTSVNAERMTYKQSAAEISMPSTLVIEFEMRMVSGSTSSSARGPVAVPFAVSPSTGNGFQIDVDKVFLNVSNVVPDTPAFVDTDDTFHTYRIEVTGSVITVYQDDVQILTGSTYTDPAVFGTDLLIGWGMNSSLSHGVSEWKSFQHNAQPPIVTATWADAFAIQADDGAIHPALLVGLSLGTATVTSQTSTSITLTYSGIDPNSDMQINLATYDAPFYPPDPFEVVSPSRIEVEMDQSGTMFTLGIDFSSTTGELLDPASIVGFNPQPEPPAGGIYGFNPQPEPPKLGEGLGIFMPLSGGTGAPGSTQISLTIEVLDGSLTPLPLSLVGLAVPAMGKWALGTVLLCVMGTGLWNARRKASLRAL